MVLYERKIKLEEKFKPECGRYENLEPARMQLLIEDHRDRALERQQRSDEHRMIMELLKTVIEKLNP